MKKTRYPPFFLNFLIIFSFWIGCNNSVFAKQEQEVRYMLPDSINAYWDAYVDNPSRNIPKLLDYVEYLQRNKKEYDYGDDIKNELSKVAKESKNLYYKAYANYLMGAYYLTFNYIEEASEFLNRALSAALEANENKYVKTLKIKIHFAIGGCYFYLGNLQRSLESNNAAKVINKSLGNKDFESYVKNNLALIYKHLGENKQAISLFKKNYAEHILSEDVKALTLTNIASCYLNMEQIDSAILFLKEANKITQISYRNYSVSNTYLLLGSCYEKRMRYDSAEFYFFRALDLSLRFSEDNITCQIYIQIATVQMRLKNYSQAMMYVDKAYDISAKNKNLMGQVQAYKLKNEIYKQKGGDLSQAYQTLTYYLKLIDSLNASENEQQTRQNILQSEFEFRQQKLEFDFKEKQLKLKNRMNFLFFIFLLVLLVLVFGIVLTLLSLKKKAVELKNKTLEEDSLLEKLELKNKELVNSVMFRMNKEEMLKEIIKDLLELKQEMSAKNQLKIIPLIKRLQKSAEIDILSEFEYSFLQIHQRFYDKLQADFPDLSQTERRLCAFIKLNLTTKEIATIANLDPNSIRVARVRLRKKLGLTNEQQNLSVFLSRY